MAIRGYVDDGLITARAKTEEINVKKITKAFAKVERWAFENGMVFDSAKYKAIHFSRKRKIPNPEIALPPLPGLLDSTEPARVVKPVNKNSSMRWLGIFFDSRLSFINHAGKMTSKGRRAEAGLKMLVKTTRGTEAKIMRRAVSACILPILTYGAPAWWPGRIRINHNGNTVQNSVEGHWKKLETPQNIVGIQLSCSARDNFAYSGWPIGMALFPASKYSRTSLYITGYLPHLDTQAIK